jgi:hypothetical protein
VEHTHQSPGPHAGGIKFLETRVLVFNLGNNLAGQLKERIYGFLVSLRPEVWFRSREGYVDYYESEHQAIIWVIRLVRGRGLGLKVISVLLSLLIPGAGHWLQRRKLATVFFFVAAALL